jgi:hypothetical protein
VETSIAKGAKVLLGGQPLQRQGYFYPPTILTEVQPGMPAYHEEFFGPVASVIRVRDAYEAVAGQRHPLWPRRLGLDPRHRQGGSGRRPHRGRGGLRQRPGQERPAPPLRRREDLRLRARAVPLRDQGVREYPDGLGEVSSSLPPHGHPQLIRSIPWLDPKRR